MYDAGVASEDLAGGLSARGDRAQVEVRHLKLVRAVVREGGLTRAAAALHLTQSALSHQLAELERRLGATLFARAGRRLVATPAGERLACAAEEILGELERAEGDLPGLDGAGGGVIRVSTECYTAYHWLPRALESFRHRYPRVSVQIVVEATRRPLPALLEGRLDLAIVTQKSGNRPIEHHPLFDDEMVLVVPPGHPLADAPFVTPAQLAAETLILYSIPLAESDLFQRFLRPSGVTPARIVHVELTEALLELVRAGQGVAGLAGWAVAPDVKARRLIAIRLGRRGLRRRWYAALRTRHPPYVAAFVDQVRRVTPAR